MLYVYIGLHIFDGLKIHTMPMRIISNNSQDAFKFSAHKNMSVAVINP